MTRDHADWEERPPIPLKGKTEAIPLFAPARTGLKRRAPELLDQVAAATEQRSQTQ